jgi:hypothetical protein
MRPRPGDQGRLRAFGAPVQGVDRASPPGSCADTLPTHFGCPTGSTSVQRRPAMTSIPPPEAEVSSQEARSYRARSIAGVTLTMNAPCRSAGRRDTTGRRLPPPEQAPPRRRANWQVAGATNGPWPPPRAFSHGNDRKCGKRGRRQTPENQRKSRQTGLTQTHRHTTENRGVPGSSPGLSIGQDLGAPSTGGDHTPTCRVAAATSSG